VLTRTPLRAEEPVQKRAWKEGFPKGIQRPSFNSWETGQRGGTEQKHWDAKTQNFKPARLKLHAKIKTKMTKGSKAVPEGQKPVVLITMGGPASGKTTMVEFMHSTDVFDPNGFVRIDADSIKEELPEYKKMINEHWRMAAAAVHHESTTVMRGLKQQSISERRNMIIDTTGADLDVLLEDIKDMREQGYEIRVLMPHLDVQTGITRAHKRAEASGRFVPDDVVQNIYQKVPKNVAAIAQVADRFDLLDNTIDPKLIYTKRDGKHLIHDEKLVKHFPGLFEAATAKTPGPDGSLKKAQEIDPAIKQLLERLKQERDKPHQKKYDPKAGDYTLDLPMVDGLSGQILEGTVV
jgi:predicted ABC-type ATPase